MQLNVVEISGLIIFVLGVFGLMYNRNIIKTIICVGIVDIGVILFFLGVNYQKGMVAPIGDEAELVADPVAQAIMITAIIIGIAVTAVALIMFIALYHKYGTINWHKALAARSRERE